MNKKIAFAVMCVIMAILVSFSSVAVFAEGDGDSGDQTQTVVQKAGDVDGSGVVDINDVTFYQLILAGKQEVTDAFTLNSEAVTDNKRNIIDATGIQAYVAKSIVKLPITLDGYYSEIIRP